MAAVEVELKFQVPAASRAGLVRALATATARRARLRALYADSADQRLARAGLALRLRQEDRRWVQTLKGRGDGLMQRAEHEVALPRAPQSRLPDPQLHAGEPVGAALVKALGEAPLTERFGTDVRRTLRPLRVAGATIEVAFDEGRIVAAGRSLPVCEVEFELKSGPPAALLAVAERWVLRHRLWLDVRTKAEAGHRLAQGVGSVPPTMASRPPLSRQLDTAEAFAQLIASCLQHLLPNQAELASPALPDEARPAHLHQWRVAVRRLRSVLRVLGRWSADPEAAAALQARWAEAFATTSAARDADVGAGLLGQPLGQAGLVPPPSAPGFGLTAAWFSAPELTVLVLQTCALARAESTASAGDAAERPEPRPLRAEARAACRRLARRLRPLIDGFAGLSTEQRHRLRKHLKRLRYVAELLANVLPSRDNAAALSRLRRALDALGHLNDLTVAEQTVAHWPDAPAAWFARGWLQARMPVAQADAARAIGKLARLHQAW